MIWYLLRGIGEQTRLGSCISYSFVGFFFSGITPSATGGQPMQLYYMKKAGISLSSASVVLMTVALLYKFVLVLIGIGIVLFWQGPLRAYLHGFYGLYLLGLGLNLTLVVVLLLVLFSSNIVKGILFQVNRLLVHLMVWKESETRTNKIHSFLQGYQETVCFLREHKRMMGFLIMGTFLQRFSCFLLTYVVYRGLGFYTTPVWDIILLQASIYIAVDMLPVPGAQGITETMYAAVFQGIIPQAYLIVSMCIARGVSFYLLMGLSLVIWLVVHFHRNQKAKPEESCLQHQQYGGKT